MTEIKNSPGYYITKEGEVYNKDKVRLKTFLKHDGYERISLPSLRHGGERVNHSVHLIVAETFLNGGSYKNDGLQVNHIDGNKLNNKLNNLELITGTENVNKAHDMGLYTYDLQINLIDITNNTSRLFRSIRELSRFLNVSVNYIKVRIPISYKYPMLNKYRLEIDFKKYIKHISTIGNDKSIYVYSHSCNRLAKLTSYSQLAILFGLPYITIGKKLNHVTSILYCGGFTISLNKLQTYNYIPPDKAKEDKDQLWRKLMATKQ